MCIIWITAKIQGYIMSTLKLKSYTFILCVLYKESILQTKFNDFPHMLII